jgi:hypothetical protein
MSVYLVYGMIFMGVDQSNNVLRFAQFCDIHYQAWTSSAKDPLPEGTSFFDAYQLWLGRDYKSSDGNVKSNGATEGKMRYGASNNLPRLIATSHKNVRGLYDTLKLAATKKFLEK